MNETQQSTLCTCTTCPGASCACGCQEVAAQAIAQAIVRTAAQGACACGPQCQCGPGCTCPKS